MKSQVKNAQGCARVIDIEVNQEELKTTFDQVYADIRKTARVPGYRPGFAPRDLLESHYSGNAQEEVIKRAIPQYYIKAVEEQKLEPVSPPEIENIQYKNSQLSFCARVDIKPKPKLKAYKGLSIVRPKKEVTAAQIEETLEHLRQAHAQPDKNAKEQPPAPIELNDAFAQTLGLKTLEELKTAIKTNLESNARAEIQQEMEKQLLDELLKKATLDTPASLVERQAKEILERLKMNYIMGGKSKEELGAQTKELEQAAQEEAARRVHLSFILEEIGQREKIELAQEDIDAHIAAIAQHSGRGVEDVKHYLEHHNLIPGMKDELLTRKIIDFLLKEAKID
ncbi:MAG: trigger factor [Candidatus Omnitrophota bacterium]